MKKTNESFARIFPLYYALFAFVIIFLYLAVSGSSSLSALRSADQTYASDGIATARSRPCLPPPCHRGWWCSFKKWFGSSECLYPTPLPVPTVSPSSVASSTPIACIPRPACLDTKPYACKIAEPAEGWCPTKEPILCPQVMLLCPDGSYGAPDVTNNCQAKCGTPTPSPLYTNTPIQSFKPRASCFRDLPCISID